MIPLDFVDNMGPSWSANVIAYVNIRAGPQRRLPPALHKRHLPTCPRAPVHPSRGDDTVWRWYLPLRMGILVPDAGRAACMARRKSANAHQQRHSSGPLRSPLDGKEIRRLSCGTIWSLHRENLGELKQRRAMRPPRPKPTPADFPLRWECGFGSTMAALYMVARVYTLIEMSAGLRVAS
ncbi:uncharacterized protein BDV17DRAFT_194459 [Aspergillus undulatus]|uniref:uncharacterized protein n=1 Tax=Aspergillus undulatus TaxID=1810928 RepID=UPI003CCD4A11